MIICKSLTLCSVVIFNNLPDTAENVIIFVFVCPDICEAGRQEWNGMISAAGISYFTHICTECAVTEIYSQNY